MTTSLMNISISSIYHYFKDVILEKKVVLTTLKIFNNLNNKNIKKNETLSNFNGKIECATFSKLRFNPYFATMLMYNSLRNG